MNKIKNIIIHNRLKAHGINGVCLYNKDNPEEINIYLYTIGEPYDEKFNFSSKNYNATKMNELYKCDIIDIVLESFEKGTGHLITEEFASLGGLVTQKEKQVSI